MNDIELKEINQVQKFLDVADLISFKPVGQKESYAWIARTLKRFDYFKLTKKERGTVRSYLKKITGYSRAQLNRLIGQYKKKRWIGGRRQARHCFTKRYTNEDILLLAETDECHQTLSGSATKKLFERGYNVFNEDRYERLADISIAHIYNLCNSYLYKDKRRHFTKTKRSVEANPIGFLTHQNYFHYLLDQDNVEL